MLKPTACILCECNCGLEVELGGDDGRHLVRLRGDRAHPASRGYACEKAHRLDHYQHGADRVLRPLRRRADGSFEEIDWDTAIREVAARLAAVRDRHGGASIFYYGGGGQGNHLPGVYATATRRVLDSRFRSSALAQEKTGEFWVADRMLGGMTRADFEHAEVALFLGKNPWHSHSIPRARVTLQAIAADPARTLIVVDPRRTETAEIADIHLRVRPGADAPLLAALLGVLVQEDLVDHAFLAARAKGVEPVLAALRAIDVPAQASAAGVDEALVRRAARAIGRARSFASFEDLGVQMNRDSTLVSYLHHLLVALTGSIGKPGSHYLPTTFSPIARGASSHRSPVAGAPIISGLVPCNVIAEEILTDHPKRYRAMIVEAANPAHSLADSKRFREALRALDTVVVIDVAMTETARLADYVLPVPTGYEKWETASFPKGAPEVFVQLRPPVVPPRIPALTEPEIYVRLAEAMDLFGTPPAELFGLATQAHTPDGAMAFLAAAQAAATQGENQVLFWTYRTLGPHLASPALAAVWLLSHVNGLFRSDGVVRALGSGWADKTPFELGTEVFRRIMAHPEGVEVARQDMASNLEAHVGFPDRKIRLAVEPMLRELRRAVVTEPAVDPEFPLVMAAGLRTRWTANTIQRDPAWRKGRGPHCALNLSPADAARLGVADGDRVRVSTRRGSLTLPAQIDAKLMAGHVWMPNGFGMVSADGHVQGANQNELTDVADRDPFTGVPHHRYVPCKVEPTRATARAGEGRES